MGPVGPIGYPGPKGLKVRECLSSLSSHPSIAGLKVILFLLWAVVTVLRERMGSSDVCAGTGVLNTASHWCSAVGVSQWRIPEVFSLCACSTCGAVSP